MGGLRETIVAVWSMKLLQGAEESDQYRALAKRSLAAVQRSSSFSKITFSKQFEAVRYEFNDGSGSPT